MKKPLSHYVCSLCRLDLSFSEVRYSPDGKRLVCNGCYSKMQKNTQEQETMASLGSIARKDPKPDAIDVICTHCNYRFLYRRELRPICPYCGNSSLKKYEDLTADKIIDEADKMR